MLTFEEIDMLKHALTKEFEQICFHNGDVDYKNVFVTMTEKLAQALGISDVCLLYNEVL